MERPGSDEKLKRLEMALIEYVEKYGLTDKARLALDPTALGKASMGAYLRHSVTPRVRQTATGTHYTSED